MNYIDSDMSNSTNTVVHFDEKSGNLCLRLHIVANVLKTSMFTENNQHIKK
jgi:hypothetical protein